ncbi:hypothetical protein PPACK8108_LOCUS23211 [Phakopsora pachyrhizi]|uniref:Uncharacterized protein n=1 Tax=Phakopsora pachyrhizi TaxID=170000 RepID=A0AAV0BLS3_PHAPC|nr:hypothetical protein PPACK8108_LOCUS23211 [Phakopsora pachyrhizi]
MAFVDTNHYVVLHFKKVNGSIPAPPIDGWWLRKSSLRNKNLWLQSLGNDLKLFQKLMPSSTSFELRSSTRDEKGKFINLSNLLKEKLDLAHSIIITHIDDSLLCRLAVDAWMKLKLLQLRDDNINKFILAFYECNLAYDILAKFPDSLGTVRDSIINSVLDTLDSYYKSSNNYNVTDLTKSLKNEDDSATALYTQLCSNGTHNPIAKHSPAACFSLHPELLTEYRKTLRDRYNKAEAHFHISSTKPELNLASADPIENYQAEVL